MSEFVEQSLEELLPVYEQLERVQLFKPNEVRQIIKRCRRYEYRLHKQTKRPDDFVNYAEYMTDLLRLIKRRRKAINYFHKTVEIDNAVRNKAEALYRRCTHRFQDRLDIWMKRLSFAKYAKMRLTASKIYSSMLKVHGSDPKLWQEAAYWEFTVNGSAVNARALLQQALRRFSQNHRLYLALFDIEINYVRRLKKREEFLKKGIDREVNKKRKSSGIDGLGSDEDEEEMEREDSDPVPDAVMQLKLAEVVVNEGVRGVKDDDRPELLLEFWRSARKCGEIAERLERELFERLWGEQTHCEQAWLAKIERDAVDDPYALFDEAVGRLPTEKMVRFYVDFCERRLSSDPFAAVKLRKALSLLRDKGWASVTDCTRLVNLLDDDASTEDRSTTLESALKTHPDSVQLWTALLRTKVADSSLTRKVVQKVFNQATAAVSEGEMLPIYELAVDWTLATAPDKVRSLFEQSFSAPVVVSAPMKTSYLRYLAVTGVDDYRTEYRRLAKTRPTSAAFHRCAIELETSRRPQPDANWLKEAHENAASEFGELAEVWLSYCEFCMAHRPELTSSVHQRATIRLTGDSAEQFTLGWTRLLQRSGADVGGSAAAAAPTRK